MNSVVVCWHSVKDKSTVSKSSLSWCLSAYYDVSACHSLSLSPVNPDWFYLHGFTFLVQVHPGGPGYSPGGAYNGWRSSKQKELNGNIERSAIQWHLASLAKIWNQVRILAWARFAKDQILAGAGARIWYNPTSVFEFLCPFLFLSNSVREDWLNKYRNLVVV